MTGAFNPALGALGALAAFVLLVVGHGRTRLHAAVLLLVPLGLLGPWILQVVEHPLLLLTGPGLTVWQGSAAAPWQLELLHPGGPGSYPVLASAPIAVAGVIAMSRRGVDSRMMTVLAVLTMTGLALGVASPHVIIALIPQDLPGAGHAITTWAGAGLDLAALALIAAALRGFGSGWGQLSLHQFGWRQILVPTVVVAAVLGLGASMVIPGWVGVSAVLTGQVPNTPAVAADQADSPLGNRLLAMTWDRDAIGYRLVGAEPGPVVRDLPGALAAPDPLLGAAVKSTVGTDELASAGAAHDALADLGVGFVSIAGASTEPLVNQLDATAGVTRLSNNNGLILWRVLPRGSAIGSSRVRLVDATGAPLASIPVTGDHGRTDVGIGPATGASAAGRRLVVAEPNQWAAHAAVTFAGRRLATVAGAQQPTYLLPPTAGRLSITLVPTYQRWRWGQLGLLLVVLFMTAPFGSMGGRRTP